MADDFLIDLDSFLPNQTPITESIQPTQQIIEVDIDEVLVEWCYRLPKGYPTVVDGMFPIQSEVDTLRQILAEMGVNNVDLPEARVFYHPDYSYIPNDRYVDRFTALGFDNEKLNQSPFNSITELPENGRYFLIKGKSTNIQEVDFETAQRLSREDKTALLQSEEYAEDVIIAQGSVSLLTAKKGELSTDTETKEGMVVLFYYATINEIPSSNNITSVVNQLSELVDSVPESSINNLTKLKLTSFLSSLQNTNPTKAAKVLADFWSSAREILTGYAPEEYDMIRTGLFDRIRTLGSKFTNLAADKWCPGDVYLVKKSAISIIEDRLSQLETEMPEDGVGLLNALFGNEWGQISEQDGEGLAAISLKAERAQGGKAKQYLQTLSREDMTYNVSKEELDLEVQELVERVQSYRMKIKALTQSANVSIILNQDNNPQSMDEKRLREKFASLKLAIYLLGDKGEDIDKNLLGAVAFGMSLSGVNPTFWKVQGRSSGNAIRSKSLAGSTVSLLDGGLGSKDSTITIHDRDSNNAIRFDMEVEKQGHKHLIWLTARSNGGTQATLEIVKDKIIS